MTRNNFLKDTRKYNFYMKRNLRFWQFPLWTPKSRHFWKSAQFLLHIRKHAPFSNIYAKN